MTELNPYAPEWDIDRWPDGMAGEEVEIGERAALEGRDG